MLLQITVYVDGLNIRNNQGIKTVRDRPTIPNNKLRYRPVKGGIPIKSLHLIQHIHNRGVIAPTVP
ncbi:hypothetical protein MA16_Dca025620 [Dendrobium catenatum]|uniref:Uncharacterized protein n=1 Tax=Dendrobium catenatum TaxID=906689 RepID=A0A2I0VZC9_9ASPA|nr:hypothetical protein MA16_Dca025620 [Dendrobium catenatum]